MPICAAFSEFRISPRVLPRHCAARNVVERGFGHARVRCTTAANIILPRSLGAPYWQPIMRVKEPTRRVGLASG